MADANVQYIRRVLPPPPNIPQLGQPPVQRFTWSAMTWWTITIISLFCGTLSFGMIFITAVTSFLGVTLEGSRLVAANILFVIFWFSNRPHWVRRPLMD